MNIAPNHIVKYCYKDNRDKNYLNLCKSYEQECSFVYKVKCVCGCSEFVVYKDAHPSVFAECARCKNLIIVYDLDYYPAAVKLRENLEAKRVIEKIANIYVNYEYSDEFMYEDDVEFDVNDISWCKIFISYDGILMEILDDETT